jgi:serine/threonine protein kinase
MMGVRSSTMATDSFGFSGHVIDGQFHAIEVAGEGGFSIVYRGQHLTLREPVAIKCLKIQTKHKNPAVIQQFTQRFFDESRIMYRLSQGDLNIVRAITTGVTVAPVDGSTVPYMVLEWLDGVPLSKDMKARRSQKLGGMPLSEVRTMFESAARAIAYAHSQGVVHRDIKPGNLFITKTGMKVLDFGMAKVLSPEAMGGLESAQTMGGVMVLSPQYVTPEQIDKKTGAIGPWTDVYSFALILVEALTNRRARDAETFTDLMLQMGRDEDAPTPKRRGAPVSDSVERVFMRALSRDPAARQADLGAFWRELEDAIAKGESDEFDLKTNIDQQMDLRGTLAMSRPPPDFSQTMPLATSPASRSFAGTLPLQTQPPPVGDHEARQPAQTPPPTRARPRDPAPALAPAPAPRPPSGITKRVKPRPPPPRTSRAFLFFVVLFVLASLGASGFLLQRIIPIPIHLHL